MITITTNYDDDDDDKCSIVTTTPTTLFPVSVYPSNNASSMTKAELAYACSTSAVFHCSQSDVAPHSVTLHTYVYVQPTPSSALDVIKRNRGRYPYNMI
jgi:hypothetical protein